MNHHTITQRHVNPNMPAERYHAVQALSKSMMGKLLKSPAHYRAAQEEHQEPSKSMQMGTAIHTAVLEPDLYTEVVGVIPEGIDGRTKEGKAWKDANKDRICLNNTENRDVQGVARSIHNHPFWEIAGTSNKMVEASVFAMDSETGVPLKARPDLWVGADTLVDIKTTDDATPEAFTRTVLNFGYHIQAAHYLAMTGAAEFVFVAVERTAPYAVGIYRLDSEWLQAGENMRRKAITLLHECQALDKWPAYPTSLQTLSCPKWVLNKSEN